MVLFCFATLLCHNLSAFSSFFYPSYSVFNVRNLGLEDPAVIPVLEQAVAQETHATLRADMEQVIGDLREMLP